MRSLLIVMLLSSISGYAQKGEDDEIEKLQKDKKTMRLIFGASFCMWRSKRAAVLGEIKEQKKYARIGGVANKRELYVLQLQLRNADEAIAELKDDLADFSGLRPLACSTAEVKQLLACYENRETCETVRMHLIAKHLPDVDQRDRMDAITGRNPGARHMEVDDPDRFMMAP